MKNTILLLLIAIMVSGCAPKMGKDILIEPTGKMRWENSKTEIVLGVLSLLGAPADKEPIRIGTDINITNRWHSDLNLKSLTYSLMEGKNTLATGFACINGSKGFVVKQNSQRSLSLSLALDPEKITLNRIVALMQAKSTIALKGEAIVEVWGIEYRYPFRKDATLLISQVLKEK